MRHFSQVIHGQENLHCFFVTSFLHFLTSMRPSHVSKQVYVGETKRKQSTKVKEYREDVEIFIQQLSFRTTFMSQKTRRDLLYYLYRA